MIVIGYYKIGKTSICKNNDRYIDLDSKKLEIVEKENERISKTMPYGWEYVYAKTVSMMSSQGYVVFISPDKTVVDLLGQSKESILYIYPVYSKIEEFVRKRLIDDNDNLDERMVEILIGATQTITTHMHNIALYRFSMTYPTDIFQINKMDFDLNEVINKCIFKSK